MKLKAIPFNAKRHTNLGIYLRDLRLHHGKLQREIGKLTSIPEPTVSRLELGRGKLQPVYFNGLRGAFLISTKLLGILKDLNLKQSDTGVINRKLDGIGQYVRTIRRANKVTMTKMAKRLEMDYFRFQQIEYSRDVFGKYEIEVFIKTLKLPRKQAIILRENNIRLAEHLKININLRNKIPKSPATVETVHAKYLKEVKKERGITSKALANELKIMSEAIVSYVITNRRLLTIAEVNVIKKKHKLSDPQYKKLLKYCMR